MKISWHLHAGLLALFFSTQAAAAQPGPPYWNPDLATIQGLEGKLAMPEMQRPLVPGGSPAATPPDFKPGSWESFARYYAGWTENGHHIIAGILRNDDGGKPGIYILDFQQFSRHMELGGLCHEVIVRYDLDDRKVLFNECYGLG